MKLKVIQEKSKEIQDWFLTEKDKLLAKKFADEKNIPQTDKGLTTASKPMIKVLWGNPTLDD